MNKTDEGKKVFVKLNNKWIEGKISVYVGERATKGRELVEVHSPWFGYEMFDVGDVHFEIPIPKVIPQTEPEIPSWAVGWCHYCGLPAKSFGFFDEPTCSGCGG